MPYNGHVSPNPPPGAALLLSLNNPQRQAPNPRTLQDFIRPVDRSTINDIQAALASGLDPSQAASLLGGVGSGIDTRFGTYQQNRQDARSSAQDALMQLAQTNANPAAAQTYIDSYAQLHPNMGTNGLEGLAGSLYPGGGSSPLYTGDPNAAGGNAGITADDLAGVYQDAMTFAQGSQDASGNVTQPPIPLHDARMRIIGQLRAQGYSDADIATAYDAVGRAYQAVGGQINAPLTSQDRLAAMAQAQAAAAQPAAPTYSGQDLLHDLGTKYGLH